MRYIKIDIIMFVHREGEQSWPSGYGVGLGTLGS